MTKCIELSRTRTVKDDIYDREQKDNYGRVVGLRIYKFESEFTPANDHNTFGKKLYDKEPGLYYVAQILTTRGGTPYGAYRPLEFFKTEAERHEYITKRVKKFWKNRGEANELARVGHKTPAIH